MIQNDLTDKDVVNNLPLTLETIVNVCQAAFEKID